MTVHTSGQKTKPLSNHPASLSCVGSDSEAAPQAPSLPLSHQLQAAVVGWGDRPRLALRFTSLSSLSPQLKSLTCFSQKGHTCLPPRPQQISRRCHFANFLGETPEVWGHGLPRTTSGLHCDFSLPGAMLFLPCSLWGTEGESSHKQWFHFPSELGQCRGEASFTTLKGQDSSLEAC